MSQRHLSTIPRRYDIPYADGDTNMESTVELDNVWNILDKIISTTLQFKHTFEGKTNMNKQKVTVYLSHYAESCGFTREVHNKFFHKYNKANIERRL